MAQEYLLLRDAARILNCQPYQITYLLTTRRVPEPLRIGGRRIFTADDLARISEALKADLARHLRVHQGGTP